MDEMSNISTKAYKSHFINDINFLRYFETVTPKNILGKLYNNRYMPNKAFDYAYALTVHNSQGSTYNEVCKHPSPKECDSGSGKISISFDEYCKVFTIFFVVNTQLEWVIGTPFGEDVVPDV